MGARLTDADMERAYRRFMAPAERRYVLLAACLMLVMNAIGTLIDNVIGDLVMPRGEIITQVIVSSTLIGIIAALATERRHQQVVSFVAMIVITLDVGALIAMAQLMASRGAIIIIAGIMVIYTVSRFTLTHVVALTALFTVSALPPWLVAAAGHPEFDVPFMVSLIVAVHVVGFLAARSAQRERRLLFAAQRTFAELSERDDLTGLGNRREYHRVVDSLATSALGTHAVLLADLDRFKEINDTLGHHAGDEALTIVAGRLRDSIPEAVGLVRLGGDEFVVIMPTDPGGIAATRAAQRFIAALCAPIAVGGASVTLRTSVGIAISHGASSSTLLHEADLAMYQAKATGSGFTVFEGHVTAPRGADLVDNRTEV